MKFILLFLILLNTSISFSQPKDTAFLLEKPSPDSVYYSKEQLNLKTALPRIKSIVEVPGFTSYQVNLSVDGQDIIADAANEPSIAVNPLNPNQIAIGWRQFNTIFDSFRQAGRSYSDDGGITWHYQSVFEAGVFRSDPVLESDADGVFYYQSLKVVGDVLNVDQWKSYDGGKTWQEKTFAYGGDKSWYAIDKTSSSKRGNIYNAWNVAGNEYSPRTYNNLLSGSAAFSEPVEVPFNPIFGTLDVDNNSSLYIIGVQGFTNVTGSFYLVKSNNPELMTPLFQQTTLVNMGGTMGLGVAVNEVGLGGQIYVSVDKSDRSSQNNVYIMSSIEPVGSDPMDIHFVRSTDGGVTFSEPRRINTDGAGNWQWFGTMSVAPNGRIDLIWNDTRRDNGAILNYKMTRLFYTYSWDAGMTFAKEQAITPYFDSSLGYPVQRKMGDYIDMQSDNLGAHIAYTATYNGGQDVYYMYAKPSAVEENPDFPTLMTNNAWAVDGVPRQGILSSTLINNGNPDNPLLAFDTIFTAKPDGEPMWLVATGEIPKNGDSFSVPLFMPTGDLSVGGTPLLAIGMVTKSRLRDANNELIDGQIEYEFDMTDDAKIYLQNHATSQYDETYFNESPYYGMRKTLLFDSLLPNQQAREDICNINGQVLISEGEKNEGRLQYSYRNGDILNLFAADFTYKKTVTDGVSVTDLDENGLATPIWQVLNSQPEGIQSDNSVINTVYNPNSAAGFFEVSADPGISETGNEQSIVDGSHIIVSKPDGSTENMTVIANNAYCGELIR